jgi:hypothetical protein
LISAYFSAIPPRIRNLGSEIQTWERRPGYPSAKTTIHGWPSQSSLLTYTNPPCRWRGTPNDKNLFLEQILLGYPRFPWANRRSPLQVDRWGIGGMELGFGINSITGILAKKSGFCTGLLDPLQLHNCQPGG